MRAVIDRRLMIEKIQEWYVNNGVYHYVKTAEEGTVTYISYGKDFKGSFRIHYIINPTLFERVTDKSLQNKLYTELALAILKNKV
jgi:predicted transglutaminase-like protease